MSMSRGTIDFDFGFSRSRPAKRVDDEQPFRILVFADLGGGGRVPFDQRRPVAIDLDNFDRVFAKIAPSLAVELEGAPVAIGFSGIDDFHPDRLFQHLQPFAALRRLREELADARSFQRAAAAFGYQAPVPAEQAAAGAADDIERLLGRKPAPPAPGGFDVQAWMRGILSPHLLPDIRMEQRQYLAAADAALAQQMRGLLHHPAFQALEAAWRGVARLVQETELDETLQLWVLDLSAAELAADLDSAAADPGRSVMFHHLGGSGPESPDATPWSLAVSDFAVSAGDEDLRRLAILGYGAARAGVPLLAGAHPSLLGCSSPGSLAEPARWSAEPPAWSALRQSEIAPWIGLALPRVLLRLPYGAATDPIDSFTFEELPESRDHAAYLWGNPALALALLAAQGFRQDGWSMDLDDHLDLADLPSHSYREDGETKQQPCAELLLGETAATVLLARGLMPLLSYRNRNAARLLRWQSVAEPAQALRGAWAVRSG
jgi:type VI secretion system protein ImpC